MSILLYNYKQLTECTSEVEQIEAKVERLLLLKKEKEEGSRRRLSTLSAIKVAMTSTTTP
jgi:hypothetical protein